MRFQLPGRSIVTFKARLRQFAETVVETLFPGRCIACGKLYHTSSGREGMAALVSGFLCPACAGSIAMIDAPLCTRCGRPFDSPYGPDHLCGDCMSDADAFVFHSARAAGRYAQGLRSLIHHLKYRGCIQAVGPLSRLLWGCVRRNWRIADFDWVVPVPLHPKRLRKRGFNQAAQLLRFWPKLAQACQQTGFDPSRINERLLVRSRYTLPQIGLNQKQRKANVKKAFHVTDAKAIKNATILIVDDVFTTGSTINACAASLMKAGAARVCAATLARSL